ncbi:MAG: RNA polymerase subunit sigma-70 [Myxococcales bacterium]|nr:RNA polymerase subunit sigma-70 [Myxococcales bacterium]
MVARRSYGRLLAFLASRSRDVQLAEDCLGDAFRLALEHWPRSGVPDNPEGWLIQVARREVLGQARRRGVSERAEPALALLAEERLAEPAAMLPDRRLQLLFACAHPAIASDVHAPLMLQCVLGFDAVAIARAWAVKPEAMGQRLVRAKSKLRGSGVPFAVPEAPELPERLPPVLDAIYAAFGLSWERLDDTLRQDWATEALWLAELLTRLLPDPEALGLRALMLYSHSRRAARRDDRGAFVPLEAQDTRRWDMDAITRADDLLARAAHAGRPGRYQLEAAIQAVHAERRHTGRVATDALDVLHGRLRSIAPTLGNTVSHAAVLCRLGRATESLALLAGVESAAGQYQPWWAVRAEALSSQGDPAASAAYDRAIALSDDAAVKTWLKARRSPTQG